MLPRLPMVLITGPSGAGKSTAATRLRSLLTTHRRFVVIDSDLMLHHAEANWRAWCNDWLLLAYGLAENDLILVLCGALDPKDLLDTPAARLINGIRVILLKCPNGVLRQGVPLQKVSSPL